ncbi:MAG TPA: TonB-dependent receptor [Bryobacteraceae bacterium]|nr:TonB-dependent receptor [Bryobacteraceae bacterium]
MSSRNLLVIFFLAAAAWGQEFRASISGVVLDSSGAPVPGAKVVARHQASNLTYEGTTNDSGRYVLSFLQPGAFVVTAERSGFKKFSREGVQLLLTDRAVLDITLEVGTLSESVTVTGSVSELQTETAVRIHTIERTIIEKAPNNGRNPFLLTHALPGVEKTGYWGSAELYAYGQVGGVSISGGRPGENETVIDGVTDTRPSRGVNFIPALDSLAEVSVQTNVYDAQYARTGGGVNVFGTKSGTNTIHGAMYEHLKHENFIANGWARNKAVGGLLAANPNAVVPPRKFRNNTFGFEVDGPIYIPKLVDGRNRLFFLISWEGLRERNPSTQVRTLPSPEQLTGDFSRLRGANNQVVTIFDPLTTDPVTGLRQPFPGNRIPSNRINPIAAKVASFYPQANAPGETGALLNNYINVSPSKNGYNQWIGKLDYRINSKNSVFFRRGETPWENFSRVVWGTNEAEPSPEAPSTRRAISYAADWTSTITPSLVFNLRGGLARTENYGGNIYGVGYDPRKLGFPDSLVAQFDALQYPRFNLGTYSELGTSPASSDISDSWSLQPNVNWIRGSHVIKIGTELRLYNQNNIGPGNASGSYTFSRTWTQQDAQRADAASGNEFASFLLGYPASGFVDKNINPAVSWKYYGVYFQDDWKLTRRLSLNIGLRYDYEAPAAERFNRMIRGFAFDQASPIASRVQGLDLTGGLVYAGTGGEERQAFQRDLNNFQPRFGAAYKVSDKLVLRGGYGLVYLGQHAVGPSTGYSRQTGIIATADGGLTPRVSLTNPFPDGLLKPVGNSLGLSTNLGLAASFQYLNRPLPYSHQYSFGFQYELPWNIVADASYVGNQTRRLPIGAEFNFLPISELNKPAAYYTERVPNPMAGLLPDNGAKNGATIPRQDLLVPFPQYTSVSASNVPIGRQRYDAMQSSLTKRFSMGLTFRVNYTIAKTLEQVNFLNSQDFNPSNIDASKLEKRLVDYDAPQHFAVLGSLDLPYGKGRKWGSSLHPVANFFFGGWNIAANYNKRSGLPLAFPNAAPLTSRSAKLSGSERDELARRYGKERWDISYVPFFDPALFPKQAGPAPFTLRDFPTRFPDVRSFGMNNLDLTFAKEWAVRERVRFIFRAETMNAFNTTYFKALSGTNVTASNFGFLNQDPTLDPRMTVLVLRLTF